MHITPELRVFIGVTGRNTWRYEGHWRGSNLEREAGRFGWRNITHVLVEGGLTKKKAFSIRRRLIDTAGGAGLNRRTAVNDGPTPDILKTYSMKEKEKQTSLMASTANGVKLSLTFDNRYESRNGYPVVIRVYKDRQWGYVGTGFSMSPEEFRNCEGETLAALEKKYDTVRNWCARSVSEGTFSIKGAKSCLKESDGGRTLAGLMELKMETVSAAATIVNYKSAAKWVHRAYPDGLPAGNVNPATIGEIVRVMKENGKSDTTVNIYLSIIKASINYAIYKGLFDEKKYPFKKNAWECDKVTLPKSAKRQDRWIGQEEIRSLAGKFYAAGNRWTGMFLFSYLTGGMNLADMVDLKFTREWITKGVIRWTRRKTAHKKNDTIAVPVSSHVARILENMGVTPVEGEPVFPFLKGDYRRRKANAAACLNRELKKHGISMTYARHSFATVATKNRMPASMVEQSMGHSLSGVSSHYVAGWDVDEMRPYFEALL